jgi:enoyl-CoA hydratase/carnithine racemase
MTNKPLALSSTVSLQLEEGIAFINIDNPPVNALSGSVIDGMNLALDRIDGDSDIGIAILYCSGRGFIAGADLKEIGSGGRNRSDDAAAMVNRLAHTSTPVVAAIHGNALGGGFETAIACDYRCCTTDALLGLPEVSIGAMPGYGATQRLPRLAGYDVALEMMISGNAIDAGTANRAGIIDRVYRDDLLASAKHYAQELLALAAPTRKVDDMPTHSTTSVDSAFSKARALAESTRPGEDAPSLILESVHNTLQLPIAEGLRRERELSSSRVNSPQGLAMRHLFFAERGVRKSSQIAHYLTSGGGAVQSLSRAAGNSQYQLGNELMAPLVAAMDQAEADGVSKPEIASDLKAFGWQSERIPQLLDILPMKAIPNTQRPPAPDWLRSALGEVAGRGSLLLSANPWLTAPDLDVISCVTYGFPRFRGGVMYFAGLPDRES